MIIFRSPVPLPYTPVKVAFLTGLSNPASCALSQPYQQFMSNLESPEEWKIYLNFPYVPSTEEEKNVLILKASLANFRQFLGAQSPRYRDSAQRHLTSVLTSCKVLFLVVGSCGLEIFNQAWTEDISLERVKILAFGPVAHHRPYVSCTLIQGTRDYISRLFFRDVDVVIPDSGHMDYVSDRRVFELVNQSLNNTISTLKDRTCLTSGKA